MARNGWVGVVASLSLAACAPPGGDGEQQDDAVLPATESEKAFGDYVVHFNAMPTIDLSPEIAAANGIVRSNNRVMLTVSILRRTGSTDSAVPGRVEASAANLTGQLRNLPTNEIREENAIYYIAETQIVNGETLIFTVEATPEGQTEPFVVRFRKQFFVD